METGRQTRTRAASAHHGRNALRAIVLAMCAAGMAQAQTYPNKPIRWIVPFPPGGSVDGVARRIGPALAASLGQQVVLDNRSGASGNIAAEIVSHAPPDGYTLMGHTVPFVVNTFLYSRVPYDVLRDFVPVSLLASTDSVITVHPSVPATNIKELIALARSKPGTLLYGSAGIGTNPHICGELLNYLAKTEIGVVHFKGGAPARTAVIAGELPITYNSVLETVGYVRASRLRALGVTGSKRSPAMPNVPTLAESGVPGYEFAAWHGLLAPKGTPAVIANTLRERIKAAVGTPETTRQLEDQGLDVIISTPDEFAAYLKRELAKWGPVVKERRMRAD
jgi:tripartite-type tricarboxylate transporter receptor subunit TctC